MKKMVFVFMVIAFTSTVLFTSCEKDKNEIVGTWVTSRAGFSLAIPLAIPANITADITDVRSYFTDDWMAQALAYENFSAKEMSTLRFTDDGKVYQTEGGVEKLVGTYTYSNGKLAITSEGTTETEVAVVAGNTLTITTVETEKLIDYVDDHSLSTIQAKSYYSTLNTYTKVRTFIVELTRK